MTTLPIPAREVWGDLDVDYRVRRGYELFGGKSVAEATPYFVENPICRSAELLHSPAAIFQYYMSCFTNFLMLDEAAGESDVAICFMRLVRNKLQADPSVSKQYRGIAPAVNYVADHQKFYDADVNIYGSFRDLRREIEGLAAAGLTGDTE